MLKALTGVYPRTAKRGQPRIKDPNVQRGHVEARSLKIGEFVQSGYPWCEMTAAEKARSDAHDAKKPGWLPSAIIVNILQKDERRNGTAITDSDLITIQETENIGKLILPESYSGKSWEPKSIFPLEVIDGQHRLWAFANYDPGDTFQLPVVAFHGLDRSWQAYLFWSVNVTPKKINRSLAYDLYPLLRREDWLEKFTGHKIYRETRCQELVESLWAHPESPWNDRINLLGDTGQKTPMVTQAAWIRSLIGSFVKEWADEESLKIGGLFGAPRNEHQLELPWNRPMQAAFLIQAGVHLAEAIRKTKSKWAQDLRKSTERTLLNDSEDAAFSGKFSLLTTDQGIRGWLQITNDLFSAEHLSLKDWIWDAVYRVPRARTTAATDEGAVTVALRSLAGSEIDKFLREIAESLATYDWRISSTPNLTERERLDRAVFRGSGGYRELRRQLLFHLKNSRGQVGKAAEQTIRILGYDKP